jgi:hypothetical protein
MRERLGIPRHLILVAGEGSRSYKQIDFGRKRLAAARTQPLVADEPNIHCISKKPRSSGAPSE